MTDKEYLIGKTFRRNKYGLSDWEDTITSTTIVFSKEGENLRPVIKIKGTVHWYDLSEIVLTNIPVVEIGDSCLVLSGKQRFSNLTKAFKQ